MSPNPKKKKKGRAGRAGRTGNSSRHAAKDVSPSTDTSSGEDDTEEEAKDLLRRLVEVEEMKAMIEEMSAKMVKMEKEIEDLRNQKNKEATLLAKRGMVLRGIAIDADTHVENEEDAKFVLQDMLGLDYEDVEEVKMLQASPIARQKAKEEDTVIERPLLIRFKSEEAKFAVFSSLPILKRKKVKAMFEKKYDTPCDLRFQTEVPWHLKKEFLKIEEKAYSLRQKNKGLKTRIKWAGLKIKLQVKAPGDIKFSDN